MNEWNLLSCFLFFSFLFQWFWASIQIGACADETMYLFDEHKVCKIPDKGVIYFQMTSKYQLENIFCDSMFANSTLMGCLTLVISLITTLITLISYSLPSACVSCYSYIFICYNSHCRHILAGKACHGTVASL